MDILSGMGFEEGFDMDSFFDIKPMNDKKEEKKEKKEPKTKSDKASKAKTNNMDCDVTLPVSIKARNFVHVYEGNGTKKLSEVCEHLLKAGYEQFKISGFRFVYVEGRKTIYACDNDIMPSPIDEMVELDEDKTVMVCDGELKAEFGLEHFPGADKESVRVDMLAEKFVEVNPRYAGCQLKYDVSTNTAYPVLVHKKADVVCKEKVNSIVCEGSVCTLDEELTEDYLNTEYGNLVNEVDKCITIYQKEQESEYLFISYFSTQGYKIATNNAVKKKESKKVVEKYALPFEVLIANTGERINLDESDFDGEKKVTLEQVKKVISKRHGLFRDTTRKMDHFYDDEKKLLSVLFISGSKGCELIRTKEEYESVKALDFFDGIYCGEDTIRVRVLPSGVYKTYKGKGRNTHENVKFEWERKLPKIPEQILYDVIAYFKENLYEEAMVKILYHTKDKRFVIQKAEGKRGAVFINYEFQSNMELLNGTLVAVMEIHSHNTMHAFFSCVDNEDEKDRPGVFGVIGCLDNRFPEIMLRAGADGLFCDLSLSDVFEMNDKKEVVV